MAVAYLYAESIPTVTVAPAEPESDSRQRLLAAICKVAAEQGYAGLSPERVARAAGLAPEQYFRHFETEDQGLLAAFDYFAERLWREAFAAAEEERRWALKVRVALAALVDALVESAPLARVFAIEAVTGSLAFVDRQVVALDRFAELLAEGRRVHPRAGALPEATERALVGGVASIVAKHLLYEDAQELRALEPQLVEFVLIPYLDLDEAKRVAAG